MSGIALLRRLLMKQAMKKSAGSSGIMSLNKGLVDDVERQVSRWVESAKRQGQDIDKMSEQELKYIIELNKPKGPMIGEHRVIDATSPEGKEITESLFGKKPADVLDLSGKKIPPGSQIMGGKEVVVDVVGDTVTQMKAMTPMDAMKEANSVIGRKGKYKNLTIDESQDILKKTNDHIFERDIKYDEFGEIIKPDPEDFAHGGRTGTGLNYLLGEDDQNVRVPFEKAGKVDLGAILKGILPEREPSQLREGLTGSAGPRAAGRPRGLQEVLDIQESIKADKGEQNKYLGVLSYILDNADQELAENIIAEIGSAQIKTLTTMSGYKQDLFEKTGVIPIDGETIYNLVINDNILGKYNLDVNAIADAVGTKEIAASLKNNDMGLSWNSESGQMEGSWTFNKKEGPANQETKWSFTPKISKNDIQDSQEISLSFDKAINNGDIQFSASEKADSGGDNRTLKFNWTGKEGEDGKAETMDITHLSGDSGNQLKFDGVKSFDFYNIDGNRPTFSLQSTHDLNKGDENYLATAKLPLPYDFSLYGKKGSDIESGYGFGYKKDFELDNPFTKDKSLDNKGILSINADANLATGDKDVMFNFRMPLNKKGLRKKPINFDNPDIQSSQMKDHVWINGELVFMPEKKQFEYKQTKDSEPSWSADTAGEAYDIYKSEPWIPKDRMHMPPIRQAEGGIARLGFAGGGLAPLLGEPTYADGGRIGLAGGKLAFDAARRAFLKIMGAGAAGTVAAKSGLFSLLKAGKPTAQVLTSVPIKAGVDGMPVWFKPLVNKVIKEGDDVTKKFATVDREIVHKSTLPNSKTDVLVTQDLTTGNVSVDIGLTKHGFADGKFGQPVRLEYKASEVIEPTHIENIKRGSRFEKTGKPTKTKEEFWVEEAEFTGGHPENVKFEDSTFNKFGKHESDFSEVEAFSKGKPKKVRLKQFESSQKEAEDLADHFSNYPKPDDFASGGRVPLAGGGGIMKLIKKLLAKTQDKKLPWWKRMGFDTPPVGYKSLMETGKYAKKNPIDAAAAAATGTLIARSLHKDKKASGGLAGMLGE